VVDARKPSSFPSYSDFYKDVLHVESFPLVDKLSHYEFEIKIEFKNKTEKFEVNNCKTEKFDESKSKTKQFDKFKSNTKKFDKLKSKI
jgi:hypothetical protein